jgi:UDP-N-acetylglucosamine 2-epimerase
MKSPKTGTDRLRVMTVVGTRPELIRLSIAIAKFDIAFEHFLLHTGQNSDPQLSDVFFRDLGIRQPDAYLGVDNTTLGSQIGDVIKGTEKHLLEFRPDALVVLGDTNSSMSAVIAKRLGIVVYHLEAGNRSFDSNVPEEINRRLIDHVADFNLVYSEHARQNLLREGLHPRFIAKTGSPLAEIALGSRGAASNDSVLKSMNLSEQEYFVASLHRQENIDDLARARQALMTLRNVASYFDTPVVLSTHPRLRSKLESLGPELQEGKEIIFSPPFGFWDYLELQRGARCVISDSGSVSEESAIFGFRAVTMRDSMERPEALEAGSVPMVGLGSQEVIQGIELVADRNNVPIPPDYQITDFSARLLTFIYSTASQRDFWLGLRGGWN